MVQQVQALATKTGARVQKVLEEHRLPQAVIQPLYSELSFCLSLSPPLCIKAGSQKGKNSCFFEMTEALALAISALYSYDGKKPDFR